MTGFDAEIEIDGQKLRLSPTTSEQNSIELTVKEQTFEFSIEGVFSKRNTKDWVNREQKSGHYVMTNGNENVNTSHIILVD